MADQEIIKHGKNVYRIWTDHNHDLWHKLKELFKEVLIIVFAVSLSIWLHDHMEYMHEQKEVREFLSGLRTDLVRDSATVAASESEFRRYSAAYGYICSVPLHAELSHDSISRYQDVLFSGTEILDNAGRFEGFKSSGKIGTIENKDLQNDIMSLYEQDNPALKITVGFYNKQKWKLMDYFIANQQRTSDSTDNGMALFKRDECRNLCSSLINVDQITGRYDACLARMRKIISEINKECKPD